MRFEFDGGAEQGLPECPGRRPRSGAPRRRQRQDALARSGPWRCTESTRTSAPPVRGRRYQRSAILAALLLLLACTVSAGAIAVIRPELFSRCSAAGVADERCRDPGHGRGPAGDGAGWPGRDADRARWRRTIYSSRPCRRSRQPTLPAVARARRLRRHPTLTTTTAAGRSYPEYDADPHPTYPPGVTPPTPTWTAPPPSVPPTRPAASPAVTDGPSAVPTGTDTPPPTRPHRPSTAHSLPTPPTPPPPTDPPDPTIDPWRCSRPTARTPTTPTARRALDPAVAFLGSPPTRHCWQSASCPSLYSGCWADVDSVACPNRIL